MDKNEFELISTINGFDICERGNGYRVFHSDYQQPFIADFSSLKEAEEFCRTENADDWVRGEE
ncbi:hypothetical protein ACE3MQ_25115 [Paenibacillus lentus]|uniref:hypothetical protein n=1 Tax=Paenibacillus lentus TaxID=1338368 RepID=UPI003649A450